MLTVLFSCSCWALSISVSTCLLWHLSRYRSFSWKAHYKMHKIGAGWEEHPSHTPVSETAEVRVMTPHHWCVMLWHYLESPATGSRWVRIYKRWWFGKSILGAYIRDQALQRKCLAWDYYSKIDLKSKKLDLMTQDALCNPLFLWLAVNRAVHCVTQWHQRGASLHVCFL